MPVRLVGDRATVYSLHGRGAAEFSPAVELSDTSTLTEVEHVIRSIIGRSEIDYERRKAKRLGNVIAYFDMEDASHIIDRYAQDAARRSADYVTVRRVAEAAGATTVEAVTECRNWLRKYRPSQYIPPLYRTDRPDPARTGTNK